MDLMGILRKVVLLTFLLTEKKLKYPLIVYVTQTQDGQAAKLAKLWLVGG